jgi:hypothetical protein
MISGTGGDFSARLQQGFDQGFADTLCAPGNNNDLIFKIRGHFFLSSLSKRTSI